MVRLNRQGEADSHVQISQGRARTCAHQSVKFDVSPDIEICKARECLVPVCLVFRWPPHPKTALLGLGDKCTRVIRAVCLQPCEIILALSPCEISTSPISRTKTRTGHSPTTTAPYQQNRISEVRSDSSAMRKSSYRLTPSPFTGHVDRVVIPLRSVDKAH